MKLIIFLLSTYWSGQLSLFTQFAVELFRAKRGYTEIFRRQPEVGLKTPISPQWSTGSLLDLQA